MATLPTSPQLNDVLYQSKSYKSIKIPYVSTFKEGLALNLPFIIKNNNTFINDNIEFFTLNNLLKWCTDSSEDGTILSYIGDNYEILKSDIILNQLNTFTMKANVLTHGLNIKHELFNTWIKTITYWDEIQSQNIVNSLSDFRKNQWTLNAIITQKDTHTAFHRDLYGMCVFMCLISGCKEWYVLPPDNFKYMWHKETQLLDDFVPENCTLYNGKLEAGDFIYLPPGWIHGVDTTVNSWGMGGSPFLDCSRFEILEEDESEGFYPLETETRDKLVEWWSK